MAGLLTDQQINIGYMKAARKEKGDTTLMVIEKDQPIPAVVLSGLKSLPPVLQATAISK